MCFPRILSCLCVSSREKSAVLIERELDHILKACELPTCMMEEAAIFLGSLTFALCA